LKNKFITLCNNPESYPVIAISHHPLSTPGNESPTQLQEGIKPILSTVMSGVTIYSTVR